MSIENTPEFDASLFVAIDPKWRRISSKFLSSDPTNASKSGGILSLVAPFTWMARELRDAFASLDNVPLPRGKDLRKSSRKAIQVRNKFKEDIERFLRDVRFHIPEAPTGAVSHWPKAFYLRLLQTQSPLSVPLYEHYVALISCYLKYIPVAGLDTLSACSPQDLADALSLYEYLSTHKMDPDNALLGLVPSYSVEQTLPPAFIGTRKVKRERTPTVAMIKAMRTLNTAQQKQLASELVALRTNYPSGVFEQKFEDAPDAADGPLRLFPGIVQQPHTLPILESIFSVSMLKNRQLKGDYNKPTQQAIAESSIAGKPLADSATPDHPPTSNASVPSTTEGSLSYQQQPLDTSEKGQQKYPPIVVAKVKRQPVGMKRPAKPLPPRPIAITENRKSQTKLPDPLDPGVFGIAEVAEEPAAVSASLPSELPGQRGVDSISPPVPPTASAAASRGSFGNPTGWVGARARNSITSPAQSPTSLRRSITWGSRAARPGTPMLASSPMSSLSPVLSSSPALSSSPCDSDSDMLCTPRFSENSDVLQQQRTTSDVYLSREELLAIITGWSKITDPNELAQEVNQFVAKLKQVEGITKGDLVIVKLPQDESAATTIEDPATPCRLVYARFNGWHTGQRVGVFDHPDEAQEKLIRMEQMVPFTADMKVKLKGNIRHMAQLVEDPVDKKFKEIADGIKRRVVEYLVQQGGLDTELIARAEELRSTVLDRSKLRRVRERLSTLRSNPPVKFLEELDAVAGRQVAQFLSAPRMQAASQVAPTADSLNERFLPMNEEIVRQLSEFPFSTLFYTTLTFFVGVCESALDWVEIQRKALLMGETKQQLTDWWLCNIRSALDTFLAERGFQFDALPADYLCKPPKDIEAVQRNLKLVREALDFSKGGAQHHGTDQLIRKLNGMIYVRIDQLFNAAKHVAHEELYGEMPEGDSATLDIEAMWKEYEQRRVAVAEGTRTADQLTCLGELLKDVRYLAEMKRLEAEAEQALARGGASANTGLGHVVPISGIIIGKLRRYENELQTALELWENPVKFLPQRLESPAAEK